MEVSETQRGIQAPRLRRHVFLGQALPASGFRCQFTLLAVEALRLLAEAEAVGFLRFFMGHPVQFAGMESVLIEAAVGVIPPNAVPVRFLWWRKILLRAEARRGRRVEDRGRRRTLAAEKFCAPSQSYLVAAAGACQHPPKRWSNSGRSPLSQVVGRFVWKPIQAAPEPLLNWERTSTLAYSFWPGPFGRLPVWGRSQLRMYVNMYACMSDSEALALQSVCSYDPSSLSEGTGSSACRLSVGSAGSSSSFSCNLQNKLTGPLSR